MPFRVEHDVSLQSRNTLGTPAIAACYATVETNADAAEALYYAHNAGLPVMVLGAGSNIVLPERVLALVVQESRRGISVLETSAESVRLRVNAGEEWHGLVSWCLQQGYYGLENLALIPGTVGAAPIQNIGAYGVEIGDFLTAVKIREFATGETRDLEHGDCRLGYRDSIFKHELRDRAWVESIELCLPLQHRPAVEYPSLANYLAGKGIKYPDANDIFDAVVSIRSERLPDPAQTPNAGSFFKNPVVDKTTLEGLLEYEPDMPHFSHAEGQHKLAAAWLIERCGFKSDERAVRVHREHALVIINPVHRPGVEIQALASKIQSAVKARFAITLEQEPRSYV